MMARLLRWVKQDCAIRPLLETPMQKGSFAAMPAHKSALLVPKEHLATQVAGIFRPYSASI
jgi:hypothetical protein